ncbi:MAG: 2-hydroxyacyl-CoA dehydratase family protein [Thermoanaerobaculia bacterium]|nr:2-hydroxyacyl-CoA dehydratase family protein [Thermoanaerobaculia bacterium]
MQTEIVGRARREGTELIGDWFAGLDRTAKGDGQSAYVFVMGSFAELLRSFDLPLVFPEINSLQTAARKVAAEYLNRAEDYGYSPDICGYVKADVGVQLGERRHPAAEIPKPTLAVLTNACNTYIKWAEIWERFYDTRVFTLDVPGSRSLDDSPQPGSPGFERDRAYVEGQIRELITVCEEVSGHGFDDDRLRRALAATNQMNAAWKRVIELNRARPAVYNALTDGTVYLGVANALRGTAAGAEYFERLVEELEYKVDAGIGTVADERYRLAFVGVPCYPIFRRFDEMFAEWGGQFVTSTYLWFASGGSHLGYQYDLERPVESLAEGTLLSVRDAMDTMFHQSRALVGMIDDFSLDGVVYHPIKSCRTVSTGLADSRRALAEIRDVPSLFLESDMMDQRVVSEAQMKNRIDAYFEGLAARQARERRAGEPETGQTETEES